MTREEIEAVRNHISNIPEVGAMYAPVLLEWLDVMLRQQDEARAVLGEAWMTGGVTLADGIRRKMAALEALR